MWKVTGWKPNKITDFHSLKLRCSVVIPSIGHLPAGKSLLCGMTSACPSSL